MNSLTPSADAAREKGIVYRQIDISRKTRLVLWFMKLFMRRMLKFMVRSKLERMAKIQMRVAAQKVDLGDTPLDYRVVGRVPGHVIGNFAPGQRPVILWLHGGAFILPAAPSAHVKTVARLAEKIGADAFLPDYRLAPANPFPGGLDDCERSYQALLDMGYSPGQIVMGGDSAGGNLCLALLHRLYRKGMPMPAGVVPVSPATEMTGMHTPPSRYLIADRDALLPGASLAVISEFYNAGHDASDPELSPMYMDCDPSMPPLFFTVSDNEILLDDSVQLAKRMIEAGMDVSCQVWPTLPHAFPLFSGAFEEARPAVDDIAWFMSEQLNRGVTASESAEQLKAAAS